MNGEDRLRWREAGASGNAQYVFTDPDQRDALNSELDDLVNHEPTAPPPGG